MHYGTIYICRYIRTYLFRRFPALNSIHPFWPTRLWEMISAVVPLNFLFLLLLRIYTYDILLHRRFLHFYDFLMIYENSSNFLLNFMTVVTFWALMGIHVYVFLWFSDLEDAFLKSMVGILNVLCSAEIIPNPGFDLFCFVWFLLFKYHQTVWIVCLMLQNWTISKNTLVQKLIWKWRPSFNLKAVGNLKSTGRVCACESELWCEERRKPRKEKKKEEKVSQIKLRLTSCLHQTRSI